MKNEKIYDILLSIANGNMNCEVDIPNFRSVKSEIITIDFTNIDWKPIKVRFLETLKREEDVFVDNLWTEGEHIEKKWQKYTEDWVKIEWIKI